MMADLLNKICPYLQVPCVLEKCAWYEEGLQDCSVKVLTHNLFNLEFVLRNHPLEPKPIHPQPFPPQPKRRKIDNPHKPTLWG